MVGTDPGEGVGEGVSVQTDVEGGLSRHLPLCPKPWCTCTET